MFSSSLNNRLGPNTVLPEAVVIGDGAGVSTTVAKFGTGSLQCFNAGSTDSTTVLLASPSLNLQYVPQVADLRRIPEFTAEWWYYMTQAPQTTVNMWHRQGFTTQWRFLMQANGIPQLRYRYYNPYPGTLTDRVISGSSGNGIALNTWHHLAITTDENTVRFFQNGVLVATQTEAEGFAESGNIDTGWRIGEGANSGMRYYIDEVRVSDVCRYTQSFTPASAQFQYDNRTIMLFHFDETAGTKQFLTSYD